jgi:hypothetical protein
MPRTMLPHHAKDPRLALTRRAIVGAVRGWAAGSTQNVVKSLKLGDGETIKKALGEDYRTVLDDPKSDFAWWIFASRDNKQLFAMRHHAGDTIHFYREFEVKFGRHDRKPMKLPVYEFITGKGIKLGMKRKAVLAKFGPCFKSNVDDEIVKLRDLEEVTSIVVTQQIRDAWYIATHKTARNGDHGTLRVVLVPDTEATHTEFMVLHEGRIMFLGTGARLMAADDPFLKRFLYRTLPPW